MDERRDAGWPNQPGQGPPGQQPGWPAGNPPGAPPGQSPPPYGAPPGAAGGPYAPPTGGGTYGGPPAQPPAYGPPPQGAAPGQGYPPGYAPPPYGQPPYAQPPYGQPQYGQTLPPRPQAPLAVPSPKKRAKWPFIVVGVVVLLVAGVVALGVYAATRTPAVTSLQFAHNFQDNKAVGVTDTFKSTDSDLYAIIKLNTTNGHPNVKVVWTVVNGTDANKRPVTGQEFGQVEKAATSTLLYASVSRGTANWPVGQYKADVYLDGKLAKTAQFTVTA